MHAGFLRAFIRSNSGASSTEHALVLFVAGTGLALSSFILGQAISDSVIRSAGMIRSWSEPVIAAAATDADTTGATPDCVVAEQGDCDGEEKD